MTPTPRQMGKIIRKLRLAKKLSQAELAERCDLTREYINKIEAGKYDPPLSTINAIAEALGVKARRLMG